MLIVIGTMLGAYYSINYLSFGSDMEVKEEQTELSTMYYVPVTRYFSNFENVSLNELKVLKSSNKLFFEPEEEDNLVKILGDEFKDTKTINLKDLNKELKNNEVAIVKWSSVNSGLKSLPYNKILLWNTNNLESYELKTDVENNSEEFDTEEINNLVFAGDVMLSRTVSTKISNFGELAPWDNFSSFFKAADIMFLNLEVPLSDIYSPPKSGMSFIAPEKYAEGLTYSGVDVVSVANNHSANFGREVFYDNLKNLSDINIETCGGGTNNQEAHEVKVINRGGIKFGYLCYNSIIGGLRSGESSSGVATIEMEPWYRDNETDIKEAIKDIRNAKKKVDFLTVSPHWGVEYKHYPNDSQQNIAHKMVDAGADLIVGTHPHVVQGSEYYDGQYITYSLGNFIFDQEWSTATKQGTVLSAYVYDNKLVSATLKPIEISNYYQPSLLTGIKKEDVLSTILKESINLY